MRSWEKDGEPELVHRTDNSPYGIRNDSGFLFFFKMIQKYPGQKERYEQELKQQTELADFLLNTLKERK